jgi:hypothetical protein
VPVLESERFRDMRGSVYSTDDVRRIIKAVAIYCAELGPGGELPPALYRDLIIYALSVLKVQSVGPDNDRRWHIAPDWKRRLELIGINPVTFEIEDTEEFEANVGILNFTRKQREKRKDQKRRLRGLTRGYYAKGERGSVAYVPEPESSNGAAFPRQKPSDDDAATTGQPNIGNSLAAAAQQLKQAKADALARLDDERKWQD